MDGDKLECGHPKACAGLSWAGGDECGWCAEVDELKGTIKALRVSVGKQAVVIRGGVVALECPNPVGLLEVHGGTVGFGNNPLEFTGK